MEHRIIRIVRAFMQFMEGLCSGADDTSRESSSQPPRARFWSGGGTDHDIDGGSADLAAGHGLAEPTSSPIKPVVNVDGTPMMPGGLVDMEGKPFGVSDVGSGLGGGLGGWLTGIASSDWSSGGGLGCDWSNDCGGGSWSSHDW